MSVAFILNPGYNTINNVHHTFWDQGEDCVANESLNQVLAVTSSLSAPSHIVTGGTTPAQLYMSDAITLSTDAPQFNAPILQTASAELQEVTELVQDAGITFLNDAHFTSGTGVDEVVRDIDGVGTLTCDTLNYTTLNPPITPGDASTWSIYPATQDVNMALFNISNAGLITCNGIPDSNLSLNVSSQNTDPLHKTTLQIQTNGDGDTIPVIESSISLNSLVTSPSQPNNWESEYGAMVVKSAPSSDIVLSGGRVALTGNDSVNAFVRNSLGAVSFNSDFNTNSPLDYFGTAGQIVQSNGDSLPPSWVDAPTASNWSTFDATSNVDLAGYRLTNSSLTDEKIVYATSSTADSFAALMVTKTASSTSADDITFIGCEVLNPVSGFNSFQIVTKNTGAIKNSDKYGDLPGSAAFVSFNASANILSNDAGNSTIITYDTQRKGIEFNNYGCVAFDSVCNSGATPPTPGSFGTAGQVLQSNGSTVAPSWVNAPSASNWSTYDATSNVDLASYSLTDSLGDVNINKPIVLTNTDNKKDKLLNLQTPINDTTVGTSLSLSTNTGFAGQSVVNLRTIPVGASAASILGRPGGCLQSVDGDLALVASASGNVRLAYSSGSKAVTINSGGALAFNSGYTGGVFSAGNFGNSGYVATSAGDASPPTWSDVNTLITTTDNVFYVSKNGNDSNAGNISTQKLTIQSAIDVVVSKYPQQGVILIAPGVYSGNLSITKPNVTLLGYAPSANQNLLTQIVGNISIACTVSQDLFYSQVGIFNLQVAGSIIDTSSAVHSLNIEQCRLANNGRVFWQNSSVDNRTRLERVVLLHAATTAGTNPLMCFSSGMATLNLLDVTAKDNAPVLQFDGTATLNTCTLSTFSSTTTSSLAAPIVYIAIANGGTAPLQKGFAFAYCGFTYSAAVARTFSTGKNCGIVTDSITGNVNLIITYNAFNLLLCDASCFVVSDINKNTSIKASTVRFFSNLSTYLATGIDTLVLNKTTFAAVA